VTTDLLYQFGRKLSALSFIALILIGNFWLVIRIVGDQPAAWMEVAFILGTTGALCGAALLMIVKIVHFISSLRRK
jgi:hypothetical protein